MSDYRRKFLSLFLVAVIGLAACSVASILSVLQVALSLASDAASVSGSIPPEYIAYVDTALGCVDFAAMELASTDSDAVKTGKIVAQCANLTTPNLPPGTPQTLMTLASKLGAQIARLLAILPKTPVASSRKMAVSLEQGTELKAMSEKAKATRTAFRLKVGPLTPAPAVPDRPDHRPVK